LKCSYQKCAKSEGLSERAQYDFELIFGSDNMTKLKITVVKGLTAKDVFGENIPEYFGDNLGPCSRQKVGQEFIMDGTDCPEGFCIWAFTDIFRDIRHIMRGGNYPWSRKPRVAFASCTDGKKPVIFKLERIEE
jgi:uncharacterized repeat protein (TIGR04076 family)